jgi:hypothetical protein
MKEEVFSCMNVRVESPDGTMYVNIMEDEKKNPFKIIIHIGKAGSNLSAWASALADFVSEVLPRIGVNGTVAMLLNIRSDKIAMATNAWTAEKSEVVHSGPEAIAFALIKYRAEKHREFMKSLGIGEDDDLEDYFRPASTA